MEALALRHAAIATSEALGDTGGHISLHINTPKTVNHSPMEGLAQAATEVYGTALPVLAFCYSQNTSVALFVSDRLKVALDLKGSLQELARRAWDEARTDLYAARKTLDIGLAKSPAPAVKERAAITQGRRASVTVIHLHMLSRERSVRLLYGVAERLFRVAEIPPFVVCVTGALGSRGLTLKTPNHGLALTDMLMDVRSGAAGAHYERLIQTAGRLCSVDMPDATPLKRRLWLTPDAHEGLMAALAFYEELNHIASGSGDCVTLKSILNKVTGQHSAMRDTFLKQRALTRRKIGQRMWTVMLDMAPALVPEGSSGSKYNYQRLVQHIRKHSADKAWTRDEIVDLLRKDPLDGVAGKSLDNALVLATQHKLLSTIPGKDGGPCVYSIVAATPRKE